MSEDWPDSLAVIANTNSSIKNSPNTQRIVDLLVFSILENGRQAAPAWQGNENPLMSTDLQDEVRAVGSAKNRCVTHSIIKPLSGISWEGELRNRNSQDFLVVLSLPIPFQVTLLTNHFYDNTESQGHESRKDTLYAKWQNQIQNGLDAHLCNNP